MTPGIGGTFALVDDRGRAVTDATYRGRYLLVFFGFTHCRAICPRVLARTSDALERLGDAAVRIQPLYVTVDPERDTSEVMHAFLVARFPRFTGLSGDPDALQQMRAKFRVFAQRAADPDDREGYTVPHTAFTYLMGTEGEYLCHFDDGVDATELARELALRIV